MICRNCGYEQSENAAFCANCGHPMQNQPDKGAHNTPEAAKTDRPDRAGANIVMDQNGNMRWVYEFSFWKNASILFTTWKVFMLACLAPGLLMFFLSLSDGLGEALKIALMVYGIGAAAVTVLLAISYPLVALLYGGKYCVLFKMDGTGVDHIQLQKQYRKAQAVGLISVILGLAGSNPTVAGAGLISAARQSMHTDFSKVKSIRIREKRHTIYLNETLFHNQVYAEPADFSFIREYILGHCKRGVRIGS